METQTTRDDEDRRDFDDFRSGDASAFERLYRRCAPRVYGFALRTLRQNDLAEDVVQETFLQVHRHAAAFRGEARVGTWILSIALNACRIRLRSRRRAPVPLDAAADVPARVEAAPTGELAAALDTLEPEARELLLLSAEGHSYEELATLFALSPDQVRGRLYRARKVLLGRLRAGGGELA